MSRCLIFPTPAWRILALILVVLLPSAPALGQGTGGLLPDPISSRDLDSYARRLDLSPEQRRAVDSLHSGYLGQFEDLRQREIEEFMQRAREVRQGMMRLQNISEVKKALRDLESLQSRIRSMDQTFFEQFRTVLSERQQEYFPRIEQQRERARSRLAGMLMGPRNPAVNVDLSRCPALLELPAAQAEVVDPVLADYERRLTAELRKLYDIGSSALLEGIKKVEDLGFNGQNAGGRAAMGQMFEVFRTVMDEINTKVSKQATEVSDLNRSALRQITTATPEDTAQEIRWWYQRNAYPEIGSRGAQVVSRHDAALQLAGISDAQKQAITAARNDFIRKDNRLSDDMMTLLDEDRTSGGMMDFTRGGGERGERRRKLRELRDEAESLRVAALDALNAMLGPDLTESLAGKVAQTETDDQGGGDSSFSSQRGGFGPGRGGGAWQRTPQGASSAEDSTADSYLFLPGPIPAHEVDGYPQRLGITEDNRVILEALYDDYRAAHRQWVQDHLEPLRALQQKLWTIDPDSNRVSPPSSEDVDRLFDMRSGALQALRELDLRFFDNVNLLMPPAEGEGMQGAVNRLRLARDRQIYRTASQSPAGGRNGGNPMMRFGGGLDGEAAVDIVLLLDQIMLGATDMRIIDDPLSVWERGMTDALRSRYDMSDRLGRVSAKMASQMGRGGGGRGGRPAFNDRTFETMREARQQLSESDDQLTSLNRRAVDDMAAALPAGPSQALRRAYYGAAFPEILEDPSSAEPLFASALALSDLAEPQRDRIAELQAEYRAEYAAICDEMIQIRLAESQTDPSQNRPDWGRRAQTRTATERLEFRRGEINSKALLKLRGLLSEEQARRVPGLFEAQ